MKINLRSKWRKIVTGDEKKRIRDLLIESQEKPEYVKLFDKIAFTIGLLNILVCQYFLLNLPGWFYIWFSIVVPLLLFSRFHHFKSLGWEYFLLDFCYFAIVCVFISLFILPDSRWIANVCFIYSFGPLLWAIVLWRNSLVFHDYDKITSVYIHTLPSMVCYVGRFHGHYSCAFFAQLGHAVPTVATSCNLSTPSFIDQSSITFLEFLYAVIGYLLWQAAYFWKTEIVDKSKLDQNPSKVTSLRWLAKDLKNPFVKSVVKICRKIGVYGKDEEPDSASIKTKLVFVATQLAYTILTFIPSLFLHKTAGGSLFFIGAIFTVSVYYGASYYIEIFSTRYQWQFTNKKHLSGDSSCEGLVISSRKTPCVSRSNLVELMNDAGANSNASTFTRNGCGEEGTSAVHVPITQSLLAARDLPADDARDVPITALTPSQSELILSTLQDTLQDTDETSDSDYDGYDWLATATDSSYGDSENYDDDQDPCAIDR